MSRRKEHEFSPAQEGAPIFWRSLESKASPESANTRAKAEFPEGLSDVDVVKSDNFAAAEVMADRGVGRRNFLLFAGASAALFGCARRPVEKIMPYVKQPEYSVPGLSYYYATALQQRGDAIGLLVESHEGRPTKVEGNPEHVMSGGATNAIAQAAVWNLYDPDRSTGPVAKNVKIEGKDEKATFAALLAKFDESLGDLGEKAKADGGAKVRVLMQPTLSPSVLRLRGLIKNRFPSIRFVTYAPVNESESREGSKLAFDQSVSTVYDYDKARVILSIDSDFLGTEAGNVRAARGFANGRKLRSPEDPMNRLYVVEPALTVTGLSSDHRLRMRASDVEGYLVAIAVELVQKHGLDLGTLGSLAKSTKAPEKWVSAVAKDLAQNRGKSIVVVGSRQPARVHALGHAINWALGNAGQTMQLFPVIDKDEALSVAQDLKALTKEMSEGKVETLIILGGNPVYDAPSDAKFAEALAKVPNSIHLSSHMDETSKACTWHVPRAHEFETWGDVRAMNGTLTIQQPLIQPLHASRSDLFVLAKLAGETSAKPLDVVKATMRVEIGGLGDFEKAWNLGLKRGFVADSVVRPFGGLPARYADIAAGFAKAKAAPADGIEVTFAPCGKLFDGRYANNSWLLELPDAGGKVCWDNPAYVSPATAKALGLENGDIVRLSRDGASAVEVGVFVLPGQADNSIAVTIGWGRQECGRYGSKHGFNVMGLRTSETMGFASGVKLQKLSDAEAHATADRHRDLGVASELGPVAGRVGPVGPFDPETGKYRFVQTQEHWSMEGRAIAIDASLAEYKAQPKFPQYPYRDAKDATRNRTGSPDPKVLPLWKKVDYSKGSPTNPSGFKWGLSIDLNSCTGCGACTVACQAENNIPNVGKEMVMRGREMYWMRIDRYFVGQDENDPQFAIQPVACVQCEEAPCENVCPVNATEHSPEGLNDMAYNRCIGTRYCANNCPYKVRRFNYLNWHGSDGELPETEKMRMNPNVTVRMRGVIEKCNYCVQRIQEGKIAAKRDGRAVKDGDIVSACAQACPSEAIVFGDLNDPNSKVAKMRELDRSYRLLAELGTWPRTSYAGKIRNLNPEMA
ncbi:MAG: Fe-S-cluster-containing hydrogenase [Polyangiaceae bacterium]